MARVYAAGTDLSEWVDPMPANPERLLLQSSQVVDALLRGVVYATDEAGMPTDAEVVEAMRDATCAIAAEAVASGSLEPGGSGEWGSVKIGNVSLSQPLGDVSPEKVAGLAVPAAALLSLSTINGGRVGKAVWW